MDNGSKLDHNALQGNRYVAARNYWKSRMNGFEFDIYFPDMPLTGSQPTNGSLSTCFCQSPDELFAKLKNIAGSGQAMHMLLLTTLAVLVHKCSSVNDVCIFTTVYEADQPTINTIVPLRLDDFGVLSFSQLVNKTRDVLLQDIRFSNYPLHKMLNLEHEDLNELQAIGITVEGAQVSFPIDKISPALLFSFQLHDGFCLNLQYHVDRFSDHYVKRLGHLYFYLLAELIKYKDLPVGEVGILPAQERQELLIDVNNTKVAYPADKSFIDLFEEQVERTPDHIAVVFEEEKLTYRELQQKVYDLATVLHRQSKEDAVIALYLPPSLETIIGILGVMRSGRTFLPIDPEQGSARQEHILSLSQSPIVCSTRSLASRLSFNGIKIDIDLVKPAQSKDANFPRNELAYVIYTSGSTGEPKGVKIKHCNLVNYAWWAKERLGITSEDRSVLTSSYAFDLGYTSLFPILIAGGELHLVSKEMYQSPDNLLSYIKDQKITYLKVTPSLFRTITAAANFEQDTLLSVNNILLGGEKPVVEDIEKTLKRYCHIQFFNHYGPTETTIGSVVQPIHDLEAFKKAPSIGKPISNTQVYILDALHQPLPFGMAGELYIGGAGVGAGYLNRDELTSERFIRDPFIPGQWLYKTGDLAQWLPNGSLRFLGRIDKQVKLNGYRIELHEIESRLLEHPSVTTAIVIIVEQAGDECLVAYYTAEEACDEVVLRDHMACRLPAWMVPAFFAYLPSMPLTLNGKINRKALPAPGISTGVDFKAPSNETEEHLVKIWSQVLKLEPALISVTKSFFELGGNSIRIIQLAAAINKTLKLKVAIPDLFRYPSIASFVRFIHAEPDKKTAATEIKKEVSDMENAISIISKL